MGLVPGLYGSSVLRFTRLIRELSRDFARSIERSLPGDFTLELYDQMLTAL
jgi:hypothetical protein